MIQGDRVVLRAIQREDLPNYVRWFADPAVLEYFGRVTPMSLLQEEQWYAAMLQDPTSCNFAIELDGEHIGGVGFMHIDGRNRSAEAGLFIGPPELWDQGLGYDALSHLVRFGFEQLNLHRIYLRVFAENERAIHLYHKLGFEHEGTWREAEFRHGHYHNMWWMSLLRPEWAG